MIEEFPWRAGIAKKSKMFQAYFKNGYFHHPSTGNMKGIFLGSSLWVSGSIPGDETHEDIGASLYLVPLEFLTHKILHLETPEICQLQFVFLLSTTSIGDFCSWASALVSCDSLHLLVCVYDFEGSSFLCNLNSPIHLRSITDFQFVPIVLL